MTRDGSLPTDHPAFSKWLATTSDRFAAADDRRVTVYVRSMLPPLGAKASQEALLADLEGFADEGKLDDVSVTITGNRLCLCDVCTCTDAEAAVLDSIERLTAWGQEFDASSARFFERRELDSSIACETARALVPPRVTVALHCDGALSGVFPCEMDGATVTVSDFIGALERFAEDQRIEIEQ